MIQGLTFFIQGPTGSNPNLESPSPKPKAQWTQKTLGPFQLYYYGKWAHQLKFFYGGCKGLGRQVVAAPGDADAVVHELEEGHLGEVGPQLSELNFSAKLKINFKHFHSSAAFLQLKASMLEGLLRNLAKELIN